MGASVLIWIVMGFLAGLLVNKLANRRGEAATVEIVLGIAGAVIGGWLYSRLGAAGAGAFNFWGLLIAAAGAIVVLVGWYTIRGSASRA